MSKNSKLKNLKKERKQVKSNEDTVIVSDSGDEMEPIRAPIKNPRNAKPLVKSSGVLAFRVKDVQVQFHIYQMDIFK